MNSVYLLIGSNEGDRLSQLKTARILLQEMAGEISLYSSIYETASWGVEDLPPHLNQALLLKTTYAPFDLLEVIHVIENKLGRQRQRKWGLRSMDIDIIYYENQVINTPQLIIPHALMQERNFVLAPLTEIAPEMIHPVFLKTNQQLFKESKDKLKIRKISDSEFELKPPPVL